MKIDLFTLCDGAYNYNGKLTIVGTINVFNVPQVPVSVNFGIAIRVTLSTEDIGSHTMKINVKDSAGEELPGELSIDFNVKSFDEKSCLSLAANVNGFPFSKEGEHTIHVLVDSKQLSQYPLYINIK